MGEIKNLPGAGHSFRVSVGAGSLSKKLFHATRHGDLHNLQDNREAILKTIKQYEETIRIGKFNRLRQKAAWLKIKAADKGITKEDRREIKSILKHLGSKSGKEVSTTKAAEENDQLESADERTEHAIPAKLRLQRDPNNQYDFSGFRNSVGPRANARINKALASAHSNSQEATHRLNPLAESAPFSSSLKNAPEKNIPNNIKLAV